MSFAYFSIEMYSSYILVKTHYILRKIALFHVCFKYSPNILLFFWFFSWFYKYINISKLLYSQIFNIFLYDFFMTHLNCHLYFLLELSYFLFSIFRVRSFKRDRDLTPLTPQMVCLFPQHCYLKCSSFSNWWNFSILWIASF